MKAARGVLCAFAAVLALNPVRVDAGDVVYSCVTEDKRIALTFDDGPHPVYTEEILSILDEYGIKATFFLIGVNAEAYPEIARKEAAAGHELGNHSYSHADLGKAGYGTVCREIDEGERAVWENFEYRTRLLRPPGGCWGDDLVRAASERDYTLVCWSVDTRDWAHTPSGKIVENVMQNTAGGDILLFHDYVYGDSPTPEALRVLIPKLLDQGYRFVTVSELLQKDAGQ